MLTIKTTSAIAKPKIIVALSGNGFERQVSFRMLSVNKTRFIEEQEACFKYLNGYWTTLPEEKQEEVFQIYADISHFFEYGTPSIDTMDERIRPKIEQLMTYHMLEHVRTYINHSDMLFPTLAQSYVHSVDNQYTRERTYIMSDYMKLLPLALSIRCMVPIWHEYLILIKDQVGDKLKELFAFYLLKNTPQFSCEAMRKLDTYISETSERTSEEITFVMSSLSSDDYATYLLADLVVKKLCVGELSSSDPKQHIVSYCYKSLIQRVQPRPTSPESTIRPKDSTDSGSDGDQERSLWEQYRQRYDLSIGQLQELNFSIRDTPNLCARLGGVPLDLAEACIESSKILLVNQPSDAQFAVMSLAMAPVLSPKCVLHIREENRYKLFGIAQAYLYWKNHKYLSLLCSSYKAVSGEHLILSDSDSRMGIKQEYVQRLIELYPHVTPKTESQRDIKMRYRIFESLDDMLMKIDKFKWRTTASEDMSYSVLGKNTNSLPIIGDIRNEVARFFIMLGERKLETLTN